MEKDWIVVLYGNDSSHLATVNANVRTIDQVVIMIRTIVMIIIRTIIMTMITTIIVYIITAIIVTMITTIIVTMIMTIVAISKNFHRNQHIPGVPTLWTSACRPASLLLHLPHHCPHRGWVCLIIQPQIS